MLSGCKDNTFFLIPQKNHSQMDVVKKMRLLFNSSYILAPLQTQRAKNLTEEEQPHLFYNPIWKKFFQDTILYSNHQCFISIRQRTLSLTIEPFNTGTSLSSNFLSYDMEIVSTGAALVFYLAI
jgi:hypothetical protein